MDYSLISYQDNCIEYKLISYLYKKSLDLLEKQIDQSKNAKDLLIIIYKIINQYQIYYPNLIMQRDYFRL